MATRRKSLRLTSHEHESLTQIYVDMAIPVDQYEERQQELASLKDQWQQVTGRADSAEDLFHYMRTKRKAGKWVRLDGKHVKKERNVQLSLDEKELLVGIVYDNVTLTNCGTDVVAYEPEIAALIAKEFAAASGRIVPAGDLIAAITAIRKRGLLPRVGKQVVAPDEEVGFGDIDIAAS